MKTGGGGGGSGWCTSNAVHWGIRSVGGGSGLDDSVLLVC